MKLVALLHLAATAAASDVDAEIELGATVGHVDERFLSVTMDGHVWDGGDAMNFWKPGSKLTRVLAGALAPAYIRFGGNSHSTLTYNMTDMPLPPLSPLPPPAYQPPRPKTSMTKRQWTEINEFCAAVGWTNVFALNALLRVADGSRSGRWDDGPTSAAAGLLAFTYAQDWAPVVWELANEPDLFHYAYNLTDHSVFPVPPLQLAKDHASLRSLLERLAPSSAATKPVVVGPDVANAGPTEILGRVFQQPEWCGRARRCCHVASLLRVIQDCNAAGHALATRSRQVHCPAERDGGIPRAA